MLNRADESSKENMSYNERLVVTKRVERLTSARSNLEVVLDALDLSETACDGCGSNRYRNYDDHLLGRKLSGMIQKLDNEITKLCGGAKKGRGDFHAKETPNE